MEQEVGTGWIQGVHPDDVQVCSDGYWPAFHARKPFTMEYRLRRADGEYRWLIESGVPRYTGAGEFAGYIGSNIDVTDRKRVEEERERIRQLQADLAHRNRVATLGELTASLAHEINQPIVAAAVNARACAEWLQRDVPNLPEAREAASALVTDVTRAADIIERVRSLYRRGTPQRELVEVNEIIREMIVLLNDTANRSSISIRTEFDPGLPTAKADRVQLQQVLMNLMLNGIEAMKGVSGELVVTSKRTDGGQLLISVRDLGVGLPDRRNRAHFHGVLHHETAGDRHGAGNLSLHHRVSWWPSVGERQHRTGRDLSVHVAPRRIAVSIPGRIEPKYSSFTFCAESHRQCEQAVHRFEGRTVERRKASTNMLGTFVYY